MGATRIYTGLRGWSTWPPTNWRVGHFHLKNRVPTFDSSMTRFQRCQRIPAEMTTWVRMIPISRGSQLMDIAVCDQCRIRKIRCSRDKPMCTNCERLGLQCEWSGQGKKCNQTTLLYVLPGYPHNDHPSWLCKGTTRFWEWVVAYNT